MKPTQSAHFEHSSLLRLVSWLGSQKECDGKLSGGHMVQEIEKILDLYLAHGPSYQLQTAFNSLAARETTFGRVALRLKVRPTDEKSGLSVLRSAVLAMTPNEKAEIKRSYESGSGQEKLGQFFSKLPTKSTNRILSFYKPRLLGAVHNPLFDLWLTLLSPEAASRLRRCRTTDCQRFFVAWPGKKEYCSKTCRNRFWSRPRRAANEHKKPRSTRSRPRTR